MSAEYRFQVGHDDGTVVTLAALLDANASDEGFCEWARNAQPGDEFPDGEGCICLGSAVMFNPLNDVISAIDNVRQMRAADEADKASAEAQRWAGI